MITKTIKKPVEVVDMLIECGWFTTYDDAVAAIKSGYIYVNELQVTSADSTIYPNSTYAVSLKYLKQASLRSV